MSSTTRWTRGSSTTSVGSVVAYSGGKGRVFPASRTATRTSSSSMPDLAAITSWSSSSLRARVPPTVPPPRMPIPTRILFALLDLRDRAAGRHPVKRRW